MPRTHIVQVGDWLGALAAEYGFTHWGQIWDHPLNEELRLARGTPDLLMTGDAVQIPDAVAPAGVEVPAGRRAVFVLRRTTDLLRVRITGVKLFIDAFGPMAYELRAGDQAAKGEITQEGQVLELPLTYAIRKAELVLMDSAPYELTVGGLGPASELKGAFGRLSSLGYVVAVESTQQSSSSDAQQVTDPLAAAVAQFQLDHRLPVTGVLDADTERALVDEYGA